MKNLAVIYAASMTDNGFRELKKGESAFDLVLRFAGSLPETESVVVFCNAAFPESKYTEVHTIHDDGWTVRTFTSWLAKLAEGFDHVFFMYGDTPLLDAAKAGRMYANHVKYAAQYSFADGYPAGLTPEIVESRTLKIIEALAKDNGTPVERNSIFEVMKKDINAFDIETDIAAVDQRLLRVTLAADTNRDTMLLRYMMDDGVSDLDTATGYLNSNPQRLRTLPAYVDIQIQEGCPQACSYCPWPVVHGNVLNARGEMSVDNFTTILEKVSDFAGDAVIGISLWGEPSLHTRVENLAGALSKFDGLSLLVETSGIGWRRDAIDAVLETVGDRTEWIVSLDAPDAETYARLRGEGMKEATDTARYLIEKAGKATHVQAVRMKESETKLQEFYRFWKAYTDNIIIQKYDHVCGMLPQRKVTDLSPLNRFPCWHVKRDLCVLLDGSVPVCREDLKGEHSLGNIFADPLDEIWKRGEEWYLTHVDGAYPALCKECDEYYTYNF